MEAIRTADIGLSSDVGFDSILLLGKPQGSVCLTQDLNPLKWMFSVILEISLGCDHQTCWHRASLTLWLFNIAMENPL